MTTVGSTASASAYSAAQPATNTLSSDIREGHLKSAMPLSEAWAPQFMVKGDFNGDAQLSQDEFVDLLAKASVAEDKARELFAQFGGTEKQGITVDQFFEGIKNSNARGETTFSKLTDSVLYDKQGKVDESGLSSFLQAGAAFAEQFWGSRR